MATGANDDRLIPKHGGYRNTKTFQLADLIYDITKLFCERYVDRRDRTHDQMVQSGRSGRQNIAEGSVDSATSKKMELKLTGTSKGSLVELRGDYRKFLQHRGLPEWPPDHPALERFKALRCASLEQFRLWVADEVERAKKTPAEYGVDPAAPSRVRHPDPNAGACTGISPQDLPAVLAANGALSLLNLCIYLVDRQMKAQAKALEEEGGFTERIYHRRVQRRRERGNRDGT